MSVDSIAIKSHAERPWQTHAAPEDRSWRVLVLLLSLAFGVGWTLVQGKTFHWDAINYHFYLGYAALNDRFALDFFAAGTPSYINPYAYIPLHLLTSADVPDVAVAIAIAAVHSLILWLTFELALLVGPAPPGHERHAFGVLALLLAAMGPVFLQGLGLTLVDIPIGTLVVGGWLALAYSLRRGQVGWVAVGAMLCGVAAALKLSNALYAAAALSMAVFFPGDWKQKLRAAGAYGTACGLAFVAVSAPWSWKLWQTFGNPLFPFLNDVFASPDFTSAKLHYERFRPDDLQSFLARPLEMLSTLSRQNTEGRAPDLRFAVLFAGLAAYAGVSAWRAATCARATPAHSTEDAVASRVLAALCVAFVVAWCLWLLASGNSRYFIPMACIGAALLASLLQRAYRKWKDGTLVVIVLVVLAQTVQLVVASDWRRDGLPWGGPLVRAQYPERYREEPFLFLSTSFLSASAFLPRWHRESGMITISGFYAIGPDRPGWDRARRLIDANKDRLRIVSALPKEYDETTGLPGPASDLDTYVGRFGLEVDPTDCEFVKLQGNLHEGRGGDSRHRWITWVTCRLREAPGASERYLNKVRDVDAVFDRVEAACPNLFHPPRPVTEQRPRWTRLYNMGSEMQLWIEAGRVLYFSPLRGGDPIDIGTAAAWAEGSQPIDCSRRFAPAFGMRYP